MSAAAWVITSSREHAYAHLRGQAGAGPENTEWIIRILASWLTGFGVLPAWLGLEPDEFGTMMDFYFKRNSVCGWGLPSIAADFSRMLEREDLERYLLSHAAPGHPEERRWITRILVAGCLGQDHLWQDLGLWSRADLTSLIAFNFPGLHDLNIGNMRWKKFLYKKLCESEGIYVCRAPSCEVCVDYPICFSAE